MKQCRCCGAPMPPAKRSHAVFCSDACRQAYNAHGAKRADVGAAKAAAQAFLDVGGGRLALSRYLRNFYSNETAVAASQITYNVLETLAQGGSSHAKLDNPLWQAELEDRLREARANRPDGMPRF